jgi:hypothetical protein
MHVPHPSHMRDLSICGVWYLPVGLYQPSVYPEGRLCPIICAFFHPLGSLY